MGRTMPVTRTSSNLTETLDLTPDALPLGRLWYTQPDDAVEYAKFYSRSHDAVIRVFDGAGDVDRDRRAKGRVQGVVRLICACRGRG